MIKKLLNAFIDTTDGFQKDYFIKQCCLVFLVGVLYASTKLFLQSADLPQVFKAFLSNHFTDILAPIALFGISNAVFSLLNFRVVRLLPTLTLCAIAGFAWEFIAPLIVPRSITDPFDLLSYMIGGLLYWCLSSLFLQQSLR